MIGAARVSEQLGLEQRVGNRRTIERYERRASARAVLVQGARKQFLTGAGFAQDEHRQVTFDGGLELGEGSTQGSTLADDGGEVAPRPARGQRGRLARFTAEGAATRALSSSECAPRSSTQPLRRPEASGEARQDGEAQVSSLETASKAPTRKRCSSSSSARGSEAEPARRSPGASRDRRPSARPAGRAARSPPRFAAEFEVEARARGVQREAVQIDRPGLHGPPVRIAGCEQRALGAGPFTELPEQADDRFGTRNAGRRVVRASSTAARRDRACAQHSAARAGRSVAFWRDAASARAPAPRSRASEPRAQPCGADGRARRSAWRGGQRRELRAAPNQQCACIEQRIALRSSASRSESAASARAPSPSSSALCPRSNAKSARTMGGACATASASAM